MTIIDGEQLAHALAGMSFPARQWQAAAWADFNCASVQTREALRHIPDRTYRSPEEIMVTLAAIEQRAAAVQRRSDHPHPTTDPTDPVSRA